MEINNSLYSNSTYTLTGNVTIQEVYHLNRYTITYNLNGGTVEQPNPTKFTVETNTFTLVNPIQITQGQPCCSIMIPEIYPVQGQYCATFHILFFIYKNPVTYPH